MCSFLLLLRTKRCLGLVKQQKNKEFDMLYDIWRIREFRVGTHSISPWNLHTPHFCFPGIPFNLLFNSITYMFLSFFNVYIFTTFSISFNFLHVPVSRKSGRSAGLFWGQYLWMTQTPLFANIAELSALNVFTFLSSRFTVVSAPFKVIVRKTNQLTCHSFTGDLYIKKEWCTPPFRLRGRL